MTERHCGWCKRTAREAAAVTSCRRHPQCTEAVRAERARLFDVEAQKFRLQGTRRRLHAIGAPERFDTFVIAQSVEQAKAGARDQWSAEWKDVLFTQVQPHG